MLFPHGQCPKWGDSALVEIWPANKSSSSELLLGDPWSSERGEKGGRSEFIQEQTIHQVEFLFIVHFSGVIFIWFICVLLID
jgi:hypothetical protein